MEMAGGLIVGPPPLWNGTLLWNGTFLVSCFQGIGLTGLESVLNRN